MEFLTGYAAFHWIATWAHPFLDVLFRILTDLGSHALYYVVCAPLFWVVDRRRASILFLLVLVSAYLNTFAKLGFHTPRPDPALARVLDLRPYQTGNPSFPSGHTQGAIVFWVFIAAWAGRPWVSAVSVAMMVLVGFSRIYLGAHFPIDVLGGALLAAFTLRFVWPLLERWAANDFPANPPLLAASVVFTVGSSLFTRDPSLTLLTGCLLGFLLSTLWLPRPPDLAVSQSQRAAVVAVGVVTLTPIALMIEKASGNTVLLLSAVTGMWVLTLWAYPHALARLLAPSSAAARLGTDA